MASRQIGRYGRHALPGVGSHVFNGRMGRRASKGKGTDWKDDPRWSDRLRVNRMMVQHYDTLKQGAQSDVSITTAFSVALPLRILLVEKGLLGAANQLHAEKKIVTRFAIRQWPTETGPPPGVRAAALRAAGWSEGQIAESLTSSLTIRGNSLDPEEPDDPYHPTEVANLKADEFIETTALMIGHREYSIKNLIHHVSYEHGAIHLGELTDREETELREMSYATERAEAQGVAPISPVTVLCYVARVAERGLAPLAEVCRADL